MDRGKLTEIELKLRKEIAQNLRRLLNERRMTQKQLSDKTGIPTSTISDYLRAKSLAVPGNVQKMALALGVTKGDIDPSFRADDRPINSDPRLMFFEELEKELGIDLSDPKIQKKLKEAAKLLFADED